MALVVAGGVVPTPQSAAQDAPTVSVHTQETARRRAAVKDALALVSKAREAYQIRRYTDAVEHYRNALSVLPKGPATEKMQKHIRESLSDALIARAIDYRSVGRTEEATEFLKEAVKLAPDNERAKRELVYTKDPVRTNPALTPQHVGDVEEVTRLLSLGYGYLELGKYDEAVKAFEDVVKVDAYNVAARRGMEKANARRISYEKTAYDAERAKMLADVTETWNDALNTSAEPIRVAGESAAVNEEVSMVGTDEAAHAETLKLIQVSEFALDENTIDEAIDVLRNYVKRYESGGTRGGRHLELRVNFGSLDTPERQAVMRRRASIVLNDITMKDLLDELCRLYDVEYYYVPTGVEFSYVGKDYGRLVNREFNVPAHFFDKQGGDENADDEDDAFASSSRVSVKRENPVKLLKEMGVNFPEGANAIYRASKRKLIVRNTVQNLEKIEQLLNAPPPNHRVVVFNVMTVETSDADLQALGFDWLLNMHLGGEMFGGGGVSQAVSGVTGLPSVSLPAGNGVGGPQGASMTNGLRHAREVTGADTLTQLIENGSVTNYAESRAGNNTPNIIGLRGIWSAADVTVMMHGLSQNKAMDTLQNERLVFTPGSDEQVSIVNVREIFYPESYDAPQIPNNRSNRNNNNYWDDDDDDDDTTLNNSTGPTTSVVAGSHPTDFVRFGYSEEGAGGIGGIIQIHKAEPTPDGQSVNLALTTTINEFDGFIDWGTPIYAGMMSTGEGTSGEGSRIQRVMLSENHIYQPVFKRRMVNTTLSVANGAVLVIGGMLEARTIRYEDKVPVLGDLPLIGRLFRSEGEEKTRRALLIFAKVDVVDPTGHTVNGTDVGGGESPDM